MDTPNQSAAANRRYAFQFVSHWFYSIISFGGRALSAPVAELGSQGPAGLAIGQSASSAAASNSAT